MSTAEVTLTCVRGDCVRNDPLARFLNKVAEGSERDELAIGEQVSVFCYAVILHPEAERLFGQVRIRNILGARNVGSLDVVIARR